MIAGGGNEVLAVLVIIWIGSQRAFGEAMTVGTLVLFVEYTRRLFFPILMFSEQISFLQRALASADICTTERTVTKSAARSPLENLAVPAVGSTWFDATP